MNLREKIPSGNPRTIVISPHIDDEVLGCASVLNSNTLIVECGVDEERVVPNWGAVDRSIRLKELDNVCNVTRAKSIVLSESNKVNNYELRNLLPEFEKIINKFTPDEIFIPHPSYNQDHREVYEAVLTALRPHDINHFVKRVVVYEQPHVFLWNNNANEFKPNYFTELDIEKKIKLYSLISSQVREFRGFETIKALAHLRGKQSGYKYAEAFQILRWVD